MTTLREALHQYGQSPYFITSGEFGPHTGIVDVTLTATGLRCAIGKAAAANIRLRPDVSLLWPPVERGGYSIILNAEATVDAVDGVDIASLAISKAVFHRAGSKPAGSRGPCPSDCLPIELDRQAMA